MATNQIELPLQKGNVTLFLQSIYSVVKLLFFLFILIFFQIKNLLYCYYLEGLRVTGGVKPMRPLISRSFDGGHFRY